MKRHRIDEFAVRVTATLTLDLLVAHPYLNTPHTGGYHLTIQTAWAALQASSRFKDPKFYGRILFGETMYVMEEIRRGNVERVEYSPDVKARANVLLAEAVPE